MKQRLHHWARAGIVGLAIPCACSAPGPRETPREFAGLAAAERAAGSADPRPSAHSERTVALLEGRAVGWSALTAALAEAAGAEVLEEYVLDRLLLAAFAVEFPGERSGPGAERVSAERRFLVESLRRGSGTDGDGAERLIAELRRTRGLGDARFGALLARNAMLRALVSAEVEITPEMAQQRFEARYGPKYRARIITLPTQRRAVETLRELREAEDPRQRFIDLAAEVSTDESSLRGGLLEPISPADPAYPETVRAALRGMTPGDLSGVLALEPGYAILRLEEIVPAEQVEFAAVRDDLVEELRRRQERLLMDRLARSMLAGADVTVMDPSLAWAWRSRRRAADGGG